jgi:caa(3)-type oxidase subunit IV
MSEEMESHRDHTGKYVAIWGILVAALLVSLLLGGMNIPIVTVVLIFSVAIAKAYMVMAYFMHIKGAPIFVTVVLASGVLCLYLFFFGTLTDVVFPPV